jgi:hypothetical protein
VKALAKGQEDVRKGQLRRFIRIIMRQASELLFSIVASHTYAIEAPIPLKGSKEQKPAKPLQGFGAHECDARKAS